MAEFSATDAALNGFRVVWERPRSVAWWAGLQFVFSVALTAFAAASAGPAFARLASMNVTAGADPAAILDIFRQLAPTYVVLLAAELVLYAVLYAAMNRAVLRPNEEAFGYLRLSSDELRQLALFALLAGIAIVIYLVVGVVVAIVAALVGAGANAAPALVFVLLIPAVLAALIYVGVRLSLASPLTFATHRIDLAGAWRMTRGRFWPLLGAYFIAFALNIVVLALTFAIAVAATALVGGGLPALAELGQSDMSTAAAVLKPGRIAYAAVTALGTALGWPIRMTPAAVIYRALVGGTAASRAFE